MAKLLNDIFIKDIGWKLFSLIVAVLLWLIAWNTEDPVEQSVITKTISIQNDYTLSANNFALLNKDAIGQVRITVSGKRSDIGKLDANMPGLSAWVDLRNINGSYAAMVEEGSGIDTPVNVAVPSEYTIISRTPLSLLIYLDMIGTQAFEPSINIIGSPKDGYLAMPVSFSPPNITVEGPKTLLTSIKALSLQEIDVSNASSDVETRKRLVVYNANDEDITSKLVLSAEEVTVTVPVYPTKLIYIQPMQNVNPAVGYRVADMTWEPREVRVVGRQVELDRVSSLLLDPIRETSAVGDVTKVFDIRDYLKNNNYAVNIVDGEPYEVKVTVVVEREDVKELKVPADRITEIYKVSPDYTAEYSMHPISVTVRGAKDILADLTGSSSNYKVVLDLSGLEPGEHSVKLSFSWPNGVTQVSPVFLDVKIIGPDGDDEGAAESAAPTP